MPEGCRPTAVVWDDALAAYQFGPTHPLAFVRVELAMRLARELGVLDRPGVQLRAPEPVDDERLRTVHTAAFVEAVRAASLDPTRRDTGRGLGTLDVPTFAGMHEASARVCGATLAAVRAVHEGSAVHAVSLAGGLHHAMPDAASGFCVYNDIAVGIAWLLEQGVQRVAYIDIDVHHGDGVQTAFWDDPRVLTISVHESPRTLFPRRTGFADETGGPQAPGSALNLPLPAGTGDEEWLAAFRAAVPGALADFDPQIVVSQHGCDTHGLDPLAHLELTVDAQAASYALVHEWAHEYADGAWVAVGGGGYDWGRVVPRAWTRLLAEVTGEPLEPHTALPPGFVADVSAAAGVACPATLSDQLSHRHRG